MFDFPHYFPGVSLPVAVFGRPAVPEVRDETGRVISPAVAQVDPLSPRELLARIEGLPEDSAFVASVREKTPPGTVTTGPAALLPWRGWTRLHALVADLTDAVQVNTIATGQWKKGHVPKFEPAPRPQFPKERVGVITALRRRLTGGV